MKSNSSPAWNPWRKAPTAALLLAALGWPGVPAAAQAARTAAPEAAALRYAQHAGALRLAEQLAQRHGLDPAWVQQQIAQARHLPQVVRLMTPAPQGTNNWAIYRARFVEPVRLRAGLQFWREHRSSLARAEAEFGVPASLIVSVIGIETLYGRQLGGFRVIDALATLAFNFPASHPRAAARSEFFKSELGHYLSLTQRYGLDPQALRGSFAGAMGWPQFMPSSWVNFAVDFDRDGQVNLFDSPVDAIGSVANYFKAFGWQTGMPTHFPVTFDPTQIDKTTLLAPSVRPSFSVAQFHAHGARLDTTAQQHSGELALIELKNGSNPSSFVAGTQNFYVITRYNQSSFYAMAVIELAQALQAAFDGP